MSQRHPPPDVDEWCKSLRWKSYGHDRESLARVGEVFARGGAVFTCLHSANVVGPDDRVVAPERCRSSRGCYQEHPALVRLQRRRSIA